MQEKILSVLLRECSPGAVYLLGQVTTQSTVSSVFCSDGPGPVLPVHFFYLVLVEGLPDNQYNALQDKLENNLAHILPSTTLVLSTERFAGWLGQAHPFSCRVLAGATCIYQAGEKLVSPSPSVQPASDDQQKLKAAGLAGSLAFLAGADLYLLRQEYRLAAFMLHQAAEQALSTLLTLHTGLRVNTHSLDKLLRYSCLYAAEPSAIFPRQTEKDKRLFSLLGKAYIDARYNPAFTACHTDLALLRNKIASLQSLLSQPSPPTSNPQPPTSNLQHQTSRPLHT